MKDNRKNYKNSIRVIDCEGEQFIAIVDAGIDPACLLFDNGTVAQFKGRKELYMPFADAIEWHQNEMKYGNAELHQKAVDNLKRLSAEITKEIEAEDAANAKS